MENQADKQNRPPRPYPGYEEEIDLRDLLLILWRYRVTIIGIFLAAIVVSAAVSFLLPPVYQVRAVISLGGVTGNTGQTTPVLSPAVASEMLQSGDLFREAVEKAGMDLSDPPVRSCREGLKVEPVKDTNLIRVTMETGDPEKGREILAGMVALFAREGGEGFNKQRALTESELQRVKKDLADIEMNIKSTTDALAAMDGGTGITAEWQRARLLDALSRFREQREALLDKRLSLEQNLNGSRGIEVVEKPAAPAAPVRPRKALNIAVAGVLGLMVGVFAAFMLDYFRRHPLGLDEIRPDPAGTDC